MSKIPNFHECIAALPLFDDGGAHRTEMWEFLSEDYGVDWLKREPILHEDGTSTPHFQIFERQKLTRHEIGKVQAHLNKEWGDFIEGLGVGEDRNIGFNTLNSTHERILDFSRRYAWLAYNASKITRRSGVRENPSLPRQPKHFVEWLKRKRTLHKERAEFCVPHAIAQHSPCGCNPCSEKWLTEGPWSSYLKFIPAKKFIIKSQGDNFSHVDCGKEVANLSQLSL